MAQAPAARPLLASLAAAVRAARARRGLTREELARAARLSVRFLARVESGDGNISVARLADLAQALGTTPAALLHEPVDRSRLVVLVGLRGAGKSTVGPLLAARLGLEFVELDERIVATSGISIAEIFELHGERYYRRVERDALRELVTSGRAAVVAAAGGVVNDPETWSLLRERATLVWLRARPEEHWSRVVAQGDRRPMRDNPQAMAELREMLDARGPLYAQSDVVADTSGRAPDEIVASIAATLDQVTVTSGVAVPGNR